MLSIKNLEVKISNKKILDQLNLEVAKGEVHVIMGTNGVGKSTLLKAISGSYETQVKGSIKLNNEELVDLSPDERACRGVFMSFQNPIEIPGVNSVYFLKTALNEQRAFANKEPIDSIHFMQTLQEKMGFLDMDKSILQRFINVGFSGGEKKKSEILQMMILEPNLILLDEIDSGLDIDALQSVAKGINQLRDENRSFILVTHYNRLLEYVHSDFVHILDGGKIVKSGDSSLAKELEQKGYKDVLKT